MAAATIEDELAVARADLGQPAIDLLHRDVDRAGQVSTGVLLRGAHVEQARAGGHEPAGVGPLDLPAAAEHQVQPCRQDDDGRSDADHDAHRFTSAVASTISGKLLTMRLDDW